MSINTDPRHIAAVVAVNSHLNAPPIPMPEAACRCMICGQCFTDGDDPAFFDHRVLLSKVYSSEQWDALPVSIRARLTAQQAGIAGKVCIGPYELRALGYKQHVRKSLRGAWYRPWAATDPLSHAGREVLRVGFRNPL